MFNRVSLFLLLVTFAHQLHAVSIQYLPATKADRSGLEELPKHGVSIDQISSAQQGFFAASQRDGDADGVADIDDNCPNTSLGLDVDICGCPVAVCPETGGPCEAGRYLRYFEVKFVFDKIEITQATKDMLREASREMIRDRNARLDLSAHTDALGSNSYNENLAKNRARALYNFLIKQGVPSQRIKQASFGEQNPAFQNESQRGRDENRRGEMLIGWWDNQGLNGASRWAEFGCNQDDLACQEINSSDQVKTLGQIGFEVAFAPPYLTDADLEKLTVLRATLNNDQNLQALITASYNEPAAVEVAKRLLSKNVEAWRLHVSSLGIPRPLEARSESVSITLFSELRD